jgi:yecA family protein
VAGRLLASRQMPATTMSLEMLDGFFTALVIGPELMLPSQYLPAVWGTATVRGRCGTAPSRPSTPCS